MNIFIVSKTTGDYDTTTTIVRGFSDLKDAELFCDRMNRQSYIDEGMYEAVTLMIEDWENRNPAPTNLEDSDSDERPYNNWADRKDMELQRLCKIINSPVYRDGGTYYHISVVEMDNDPYEDDKPSSKKMTYDRYKSEMISVFSKSLKDAGLPSVNATLEVK